MKKGTLVVFIVVSFLFGNAAFADDGSLHKESSYILRFNQGELTPKNGKCNNLTDSKTSNCIAPARSSYFVVSENSGGEVIIGFDYVVDESIEDKTRIVMVDEIYTVKKVDLLNNIALEMKSDLVATLIPIKFYLRNNNAVTNATLGVSIDMKVVPKLAYSGMIFGANIGFGINQIPIDTPTGTENRLGYTWFFGYSVKSASSGVSLGIYYGKDYVQIKDGEKFQGKSRGDQQWLGLIGLTAPIGSSK